jgi:uncharacterized NAD(P)/FAD-binding protein YdhS
VLAESTRASVSISADPYDPEVQTIAAFVRVLNALENIRSSINVAARGRTMTTIDVMRDLARLSRAEVVDAMSGALSRNRSTRIFSRRACAC